MVEFVSRGTCKSSEVNMERKIPVRFVESDAESYKPHESTQDVVPSKDNSDAANQENDESAAVLPTEQGAKHQQATSY